MKINDAVFITSVASADKFYKTDKPMIAVVGKSNVGKSSIINMLANKKKLAKTSVTPELLVQQPTEFENMEGII